MKKEVIIEPSQIVMVVLLVAGIILFVLGGRKELSMREAVNLRTLTAEQLKSQTYVNGVISEYLQYSGKGSGESNEQINLVKSDMHTYTMRLADGSYVDIWVTDSIQKQLDTYENGRGTTAYLEGKIVSDDDTHNVEWLKSALGVDTEKEVFEKVSKDYHIEAVTFKSERKLLKLGFDLILIACLGLVVKRLRRGHSHKE
jgi:hypothetical protein